MALQRGGSPKPGSKRRIEAAQRQAAALQWRLAGLSFRAIAERVGYADETGAYHAVMAALDATRRESAEKLREVEVQRLDALLAGLWQKAIAGDLYAVDRALAVAERRARLLGLDAPAQVNIYNYVVEAAEASGLDKDEAIAAAERIVAGRR